MSDPDGLAANATQPAPRTARRRKSRRGLGSADWYSPAVRSTSGAAAVHGASGPLDSLHPAARSEHSPIRLSILPTMFPLPHFAGQAQGPPEADRAHQLVDPNHRHDQSLERAPPLRERPSRYGGEPQRHSRLRDKTQPPLRARTAITAGSRPAHTTPTRKAA